MNCSVFSNGIKLVMNSTEDGTQPATTYRSALQNPEISRVQLANLLRRREPQAGSRATGTFWAAFTKTYSSRAANGNG